MSNVIKPKRGSTVPTSSNLENGEIGINTSNQSLYYGTGDGVQQIKAENVTGVVGITNGGTGFSTRNSALTSLINGGKNFTGDINTLTNSGVYWINLSNCTNGPVSSGYGTMEVISYEVVFQRFTFYQDGIVYCRTYTNSQWYEWREIFGTESTVPISSGGTGNTTRDSALTALFAGGRDRTDANIVASGTYVLTTDTASNLPPESGYYLLCVFRYHISDLACGQIAINLSNGNLYSRDYIGGTWKDWVCCSSRKIDTIEIPNGANLNDYKYKGFYASYLAKNSITNTPSDLDGGAFELVVTGIGNDGVYCSQWLKSFYSNRIWVRTQYNYQEPWAWRDWQEVVVSGSTLVISLNELELGKSLSSTANYGGFIDFHYNGSTEDYTSRLIETEKGVIRDKGSFLTEGYFQSFGGIWVSGRGFFVNSDVYGTSLPAAGTSGRVFFKKA